jgi:probable phosphoglycerate mutase
MLLYVIRHADAADPAEYATDEERPLTQLGHAQVRRLAATLPKHGVQPAVVLSSPLVRAWETARLIGLEPERDDDLLEWDYGDYEGLTTAEIRDSVTGWSVWTHPITGGESIEQVGARADRVIDRLHRLDGTTALVAHSHLLRILAARWLELPPVEGRRFTLDNTTISVLGWERENRVVARWNDPATWTGLPADYQAISGNP